MGGQMIGVGLLTLLVASILTQGRALASRHWLLLTGAGMSTAALMSFVNFRIGSDFRWLLVAPVAVWIATLALLAREQVRQLKVAPS
jgi:hypothetical protein